MARAFNGSTQRLEYAGAAVTAAPMTISAWFYPANLTGVLDIFAISEKASSSNFLVLEARGDTAGDPVRLHVRSSTGGDGGTNTGNGYTANAWHHAAARIVSSTERYSYLNGNTAQRGASSFACAPVNLSHTEIGALPFNGGYIQWFNGRVAEVGLWSVALSEAEIVMLSKGVSPLLVRPESLVGYWPLVGPYSPEIDPVGRFEMAVTGATAVAHPRVLRAWPAVVPPVSSGAVFGESVSEAFAAGESLSPRSVFGPALAESVAVAEATATAATLVPSVAETIAAADSVTGALVLPASLVEPVALGEALTGGLALAANLGEAVALADMWTDQLTVAAALAESISVTDALTQPPVAGALSETMALGDAVTARFLWEPVAGTGGIWSEAPTVAGTWTTVAKRLDAWTEH